MVRATRHVLSRLWGFLRAVFARWNQHKVPRMGAALAFYTIFSLAPFILLVIAIAGLVFGREAASGQLVGQIRDVVGEEGAGAIQNIINRANEPQRGPVAAIVGVVTLIVGATGVFGQLQDALNTIWGVQPRPDAGLLRMVRTRLLSFTVVLGIGFLLLVSLLISAALAAFSDVLASMLPGAAFVPLWKGIDFLLSLVAITLLFGMIYTVLPDVQIRWRDVWVGAFITALLFGIGRYLIGAYIGQSDIGDTYGAAGAVIVLIIWVYFASQVVLLGAEFTAVYAKWYGSGLRPDDHAVALTDDTRAWQGIPSREQVEAAIERQSEQSKKGDLE